MLTTCPVASPICCIVIIFNTKTSLPLSHSLLHSFLTLPVHSLIPSIILPQFPPFKHCLSSSSPPHPLSYTTSLSPLFIPFLYYFKLSSCSTPFPMFIFFLHYLLQFKPSYLPPLLIYSYMPCPANPLPLHILTLYLPSPFSPFSSMFQGIPTNTLSFCY